MLMKGMKKPEHRAPTSFLCWPKKIELHLQAGQTFEPEGMEEDLFFFLPAFWHGMLPFERNGVIDLINRNGVVPAVL
jgi:hypothetical protein